jgi:hypothetical protein
MGVSTCNSLLLVHVPVRSVSGLSFSEGNKAQHDSSILFEVGLCREPFVFLASTRSIARIRTSYVPGTRSTLSS